MADRTVKVRLTAQVQEYIDGMEKAAKATRETGSESEKLAKQKAALQTLGGVMVGVGGAITAVGLAALKTGIEYNTLQQTTRAALTTLLGSAQAANAQMDKLDAFARNSPFSKATFITAQQQMLAFGIETKKVIPYLDALQNAVAAAGGSNNEIAELAEIFGKVQSSAKITAIDLQQFGRRGVNAAEIIGSQMGKTGAQIRSEITAGTLDASKALDALAAGMSEKYAGAAANVKQTFEGAMDRVKAAWRDLSAEFASPLVSPDGGGMLVDFLNSAADGMRQFQNLPGPVKFAAEAIGALSGATLLAGGTFLLAAPKVAEYNAALETLNLAGGRADRALRGLGRAVVALGTIAAINAGIVALSEELTNNVVAPAEQVTNGVQTATSAIEAFQAAMSKDSVKPVSVQNAQRDLDALGAALSDVGAKQANWFHALDPAFQQQRNTWATFSKEIASVASTNLPAAAAQFKLVADAAKLTDEQILAGIKTSPELTKALTDQATAAGLAADDQTLLGLVTGRVTTESKEATKANEDHSNALAELEGKAAATTDEIDGLANAIKGLGSAQFDVRKASRDLEQAVEGLNGKLEANGWNLDIATEAGRANESAIDDLAQKVLEHAASVAIQTGDQEAANAALASGRNRLIDLIAPYFESRDAAAAYVEQLGLIEPQKLTEILITGKDKALADINEVAKPRFIDLIYRPGAAPEWHAPMKIPSADGNMFAYANGGMEAYADGGFPTGIYRGGEPIHKFAEPETGWEAYISGKPGQEARNREIWVETGRRLGMNAELSEKPPIQIIVKAAPGMNEQQIVDRVVTRVEEML